MAINEYLASMNAHKRIVARLAELDFQTIAFPDKFPDVRWFPASITNGAGESYHAFFVFDQTPQDLAQQYITWVGDHQDEIKRGELKFYYIEDTKARRFFHKIEAMGLADNVIRRTVTQRYTRDKMIADLQAMADSIPSLDLPATIEEIRVFGSVSRGNEIVGDADLYVKVSYTLEDLVRLFDLDARLGESPTSYPNSEIDFSFFFKAIKELGVEGARAALENKKGSSSDKVNMTMDLLFEFMAGLVPKVEAGKATREKLTDMVLEAGRNHKTLRDIVEHEQPVRDLLESIGYPIDWFVSSMTLNEFRTDYYEHPSLLDTKRIVTKLLRGKRRGFHHVFFTEDKATATSILAWSSKFPDVKANIDGRPPDEVMAHLIKVFDDIHHDLLHLDEDAPTIARGKVMPSVQPEADRTGKESVDELRDKINVIRVQLRKAKYKQRHMPRPE